MNLLASLLLIAAVDQVEIAYPPLLECWKIDNAKMVGQRLASVKGLKFFVMEVDTNEDGKMDTLLLFPIVKHTEDGIEMTTAPSHIILDDNYDGTPDKAYFDRTAKGVCETLKPVPLESLLQDAPRRTHGRT